MIYTTKVSDEMPIEWLWDNLVLRNSKVGDTIEFECKDGEKMAATVAHIHTAYNTDYERVMPDKVALFVNADCYHWMNDDWLNIGGWRDSHMRSWLKEKYLDKLPDEIREHIIPATIKQILRGEELESTDEIWLLSEMQVTGSNYSESNVNDYQFDYFKDNENCCIGDWWWTRSPWAANSNSFVYVSTSGSVSSIGANNGNVVVFGFWVEI